jgi:hypothetical protein
MTTTESAPAAVRGPVGGKSWSKPTGVRGLISQAREVGTMVLNGDLSDEELERVRIYAGLTRVVTQGMSTMVTKARFAKTEPDLDFED